MLLQCHLQRLSCVAPGERKCCTQWVEHASALTATFVSCFAATHSLEDCSKAVLTELGSRLACLTPVA